MDKAYIFMFLALMWTHIAAEQLYFRQDANYTWKQAREHCQECFKDLVTLTPGNTPTILHILHIPSLSLEHWVGLRRNFSAGARPWSIWANRDPLAFQNWYPGQPNLQNQNNCCRNFSCTCLARSSSASAYGVTSRADTNDNTTVNMYSNTAESMSDSTTVSTTISNDITDSTTDTMYNTTSDNKSPTVSPKFGPYSVSSGEVVECVLLAEDTDPEEGDMEDLCVAMLSFGAWVVKNCLNPLPFICYEERFLGHVNVTNVTTSDAVITWLQAPGNITHYRVEVEGGRSSIDRVENLTFDLANLKAGTKYSVRVFPVKCERDLTDQKGAFYTKPNKVENLHATEVNESSITLSWSKPAGNVEIYRIKVGNKESLETTQGHTIFNLIPGKLYSISVFSGVNQSKWSEESNIKQYTKPGRVSNLKVSNNTNSSLLIRWVKPQGNIVEYRVVAVYNNNSVFWNKTVKQNEENIKGLQPGYRITVSVTVLANGIEGDSVTVVGYTIPGHISNLHLKTTNTTLNAIWDRPEGSYSSFTVKLLLDGELSEELSGLKETKTHFTGLQTTANYTVIIYCVSGPSKGPTEVKSKYTLPAPPTNIKVSPPGKNQITFQWTAPNTTANVKYSICMSTLFYGHGECVKRENITSYTFSNLKSGTRYNFEVKSIAGGQESDPAKASDSTVAVKREISLSMLCSSKTPLLCDRKATRESIFVKLKAHFQNKLKEDVFWELVEPETEY